MRMFVVRFAGLVLCVMFVVIQYYIPYFTEIGGWLMAVPGGILLVAPAPEEYPSEYEARMQRKAEQKQRRRRWFFSMLRRLNIISDTQYTLLENNV
jgi:hypothetical protein